MAKNNELKKLIAGETVIGTIIFNKPNGEQLEVPILYGNAAIVDQRYVFPKKATYDAMLDKFLKEHEGEYERPLEEEKELARQQVYADAQKIMKIRKEQERQAELQRQQQLEQERQQQILAEQQRQAEELQRIQNEKQRIEQEKKALEEQRQAIAQQKTQQSQQLQQLQQQSQQANDSSQSVNLDNTQELQQPIQNKKKPSILMPNEDDEPDENDEDDYVEETRQSKGKGIIIICIITLLATLVGNGFTIYTLLTQNNNQTEDVEETKKKTITLDIDGQQYQIEMDNSNIVEGDTQVTVYGIASTNKDGKITNKVIPMGNLMLEGNSDNSDSSDKTAKSENSSETEQSKAKESE